MRRVKAIVYLSHRQEPFTTVRDRLSREDFSDNVELMRAYDSTHLSNLIADAEVVLCFRITDEILLKARNLRWIAFGMAGVDSVITDKMKDSDIIVTKAVGVADDAVAEHAIGMMLMLYRKLHLCMRSQIQNRWLRSELVEKVMEINGSTVGVMGLGGIGKRVCRYLRVFGARIYGYDKIEPGEEDLVDEFYSDGKLDKFLSCLDCLVLCLPLTEETFHIINADRLSTMKEGAYIVNVARGSVIDEKALVEALQREKIGGAALDVFEREPLPPESPLYNLHNCIISPHIAGVTPNYWTRLADQFIENLGRFINDEPLLYQVNKEMGY